MLKSLLTRSGEGAPIKKVVATVMGMTTDRLVSVKKAGSSTFPLHLLGSIAIDPQLNYGKSII